MALLNSLEASGRLKRDDTLRGAKKGREEGCGAEPMAGKQQKQAGVRLGEYLMFTRLDGVQRGEWCRERERGRGGRESGG